MDTTSNRWMSVLLIVVLATLAGFSSQQTEAASVSDFLNGAKNYLANLVREGVLSKTNLTPAFEATMKRIETKFETAKANGELDGKDDAQIQAFYYKIVVGEVRALRESLESEMPKSVADKFIDSSKKLADGAKSLQSDGGDSEAWDMNTNTDDEDDLTNELDEHADLEKLAYLEKMEAEMGWSLSEENKAALHQRMKSVLSDLLQNELKTLAVLLITSYMNGGVAGPALELAKMGLKTKLVQYFLSTVMDLLAGMLGRSIDPEVMPIQLDIPTDQPITKPIASEPVRAPVEQPIASPLVDPVSA